MTTALRTVAGNPPASKRSATPKLDELKRRLAGMPKARGTGSIDFDAEASAIWLDGEVTDEVAIGIRSALRQMNGRVRLFISSPGGYVSAGFSVFNEIESYVSGVDTVANGVVASIASLIFQAGRKRSMSPGSILMIHQPWSVTQGNSVELQKQAEVLQTFAAQMLEIYVKRTGISSSKLEKMLAAETWMTAQEAVDSGFADETLGGEYAAKSTMSIAEARQRIAMLDSRLPKVDATPMISYAKSKLLKLRIQTDRILNDW